MTTTQIFTLVQVRLAEAFAGLRREEGQTMAEYAVVLTVIAAGVLLAISGLAAAIAGKLDEIAGIIG